MNPAGTMKIGLTTAGLALIYSNKKVVQSSQTWKPNTNSKRSNMSASRFPDTLKPAGSLGNCSVYLIEEIAPLT